MTEPARIDDARGQASVELVAVLPLLVVVALAAGQMLAAGAVRELAGHAAEVGAVAVLEQRDPEQAARDALPKWSRSGMRVSVRGGDVAVTLRPPVLVPGVSELLAAHASASAGGR